MLSIFVNLMYDCFMHFESAKMNGYAFVIWSLPAWERNLEVLINLLSHIEMRGKKSATCGFVVPKGSPK
jgi:uncharacterized membrane protein